MLADFAEYGVIGSVLLWGPILNLFLDCGLAIPWIGVIAKELRPMCARGP
jgi:hypothetical protein